MTYTMSGKSQTLQYRMAVETHSLSCASGLKLNKPLVVLLPIILLLSSACNLQQTPLNPTPTLQATPTAFTAATEPPTRTPQNETTAQPTLVMPPMPTSQTPTAFPSAGNPVMGAATVIPTVSTQEAVKSTTIQVNAGKTISLNYAITMTSGSVTLTMQGPDGVVWQKTFTTSETGRIDVTVQQGGAYDVMAHTERFAGSYQLSWG